MNNFKLLLGFFLLGGLMSVTPSFAWELNSGNIATYCSTSVPHCSFADTGVTSIAPYTFSGYSNMTTLTLGDKQISSIASGAFIGLSNLTQLRLYRNHISSIIPGAFNGLPKVNYLSLHSNQISAIHSGDFAGLPLLATLDLNSNKIVTINSGDFFGLTGITELNLSSNQIVSLNSGCFNGLNFLNKLQLNNNQIVSLSSGDFSGLPILRDLQLYNNQISNINSRAFSGLSSLRYLRIYNNQISNLHSGAFNGLNLLTDLELRDNLITTIASGAFNGLSALTALNLDNNQIVTINSGAFNGLSALTTLYLTKNQIVTINSGAFNGLSALNYLNLYNNQIVTINSGAFNGLSALTALNLDNNQISSVCSGSLIGLSALTTLYLNSNQIVTINSGTFNGLTALTTLELSNNEIKSIRNIQLTGPTNLNSLYLAANYIESIKQSDLIGLENLKTLEISNSMQGVGNPILDIEIGAFDNLTSLNDLSLSDGCLDFENNPALENYLTGISLGGLHSVNISNQKVCLTMIYTPSSSTTANVVGTYALTGGTASNRAIILIQNPGLTGMTHTWTTNGIYYTGLSGISDPSSLLNQTSLMSNYYRPRSSLPIGEVTWILSDNTAPTAIVEYNTTSSTTQNVIATITGFSESIIGLNETNHTFTENGNFVFTFSDLAGNTGSTTATVNRIYRSSGGGSTTTKDSCPNGDLSSSYYDGSCGTTPDIQTPGIQTDTTSLDELISAYNWSYSQGITTMKSVKLARIQDQLTRAEMAKMIVNYATTSLGKTADTTKQVSFDDLKGQTTEMKEYITKAYQLGLMGVNTENFNPNDLVTRAEFGTVLARLLYGTVSDVDQLYYTKPLATLREKGIIKNTNPLLQEARGYVMLMLMRASK